MREWHMGGWIIKLLKRKNIIIMHDMPSVIYEKSYKRRGRSWYKGLFGEPYCWMDDILWRQWLRSYSEFGEVEGFREGTLELRLLSSASWTLPPLYNPIAARGSAGKKNTQGVGWEVNRWVIAFGSSTSSFIRGGDRQQGNTSNNKANRVSSSGERYICVAILFGLS